MGNHWSRRLIFVLILLPNFSHLTWAEETTPQDTQQPYTAAVDAEAGNTETVDEPRSMTITDPLGVTPGKNSGIIMATESAELRFRRALHLESLARHQEAADEYEWLIEHYPDMPEPYNNLARLVAKAGDLNRAIQLLERGIATHPAYVVMTQNLGEIYSELASRAYRKALVEPGGETEVEDFHESYPVELNPLQEIADQPARTIPPRSIPIGDQDPPTLVVEAEAQGSVSDSPTPVTMEILPGGEEVESYHPDFPTGTVQQ